MDCVPRLSVVVPIFAMSAPAEATLGSFSAAFQRNVSSAEYEVIIVEVESDDALGEARVLKHGENFRYFRLPAVSAWRSSSLRHGIANSRSDAIGLLMDGAHLVTPRLIEHALHAMHLDSGVLAVVPQYCLGKAPAEEAGDARVEAAQLDAERWKADPHQLFSNSRLGPTNPNGCLSPLMGAACLFTRKDRIDPAGAIDDAAERPGGAALMMKLYFELSRLRGTRLIMLAGEGVFRQLHRELLLPEVRRQEQTLQSLLFTCVQTLGPGFRPVHREPMVLGTLADAACSFLAQSMPLAEFHRAMCRERGEVPWYEDPPANVGVSD